MKFFANERLGIDLGTTRTVIYLEGKGIALREPSILVEQKETKEIKAYGQAAYDLLGRTSDRYELIEPIQQGVIANLNLTKQMLAHFIQTATNRNVTRSSVVIGLPSIVSKVERQALVDTIREIGITQAMLIDEPFAAAMGAGIDIDAPKGRMIVDIGGGMTDIATLSYGEIIENQTLRFSSGMMNQRIQTYLREEYQLVIGDQTAERLKLSLGTAQIQPHELEQTELVQGYHLGDGQPSKVEVSNRVIARAIDEVIVQIIASIRELLEATPPELAVDIMNEGIVLTGGGALLRHLDERLEAEMQIPFHLVNTPLDTVALGAGSALETLAKESRSYLKKVR